MYVPYPSESLPDNDTYYVPATIRLSLLLTSPPSSILDKKDHACTADPGMLFESVFLDRASATRLSDYVQAFEATRKKPQLIRLMWQVRTRHTHGRGGPRPLIHMCVCRRIRNMGARADRGRIDTRTPAQIAEPHTV